MTNQRYHAKGPVSSPIGKQLSATPQPIPDRPTKGQKGNKFNLFSHNFLFRFLVPPKRHHSNVSLSHSHNAFHRTLNTTLKLVGLLSVRFQVDSYTGYTFFIEGKGKLSRSTETLHNKNFQVGGVVWLFSGTAVEIENGNKTEGRMLNNVTTFCERDTKYYFLNASSVLFRRLLYYTKARGGCPPLHPPRKPITLLALDLYICLFSSCSFSQFIDELIKVQTLLDGFLHRFSRTCFR